jgi:EAL domain-containing protein (putative c-di-GMP-specific phosphodiesterase class I)/GGDEF domain-containing protein/PAS domain-containing protein
MTRPEFTLTLQAVTAKLLVLSAGEEIAKRIESHLRNAGRPVRCAWVTDLEDLEDGIRRGSPDLVLCQDGQPRATIRDVLGLCHKLQPDLPVLLLATKSFTMAETVAALRTGARALVFAGDALQLQHMEMICMRELSTHQHIRELRSTRAKLADYEARHEQLMASTGDAVLHVQEGIVTHVNAAFAALVGRKTPAELIGSPLLDLVTAENAPQIKQFLRGFAQGKGKVDPKLALVLSRPEGAPVKATANVSVGQADGDRLLELLIRSEAPAAAPPPPQAKAEAPAPPPAAPPGSQHLSSDRLELFNILEQAIKANVQMHRALVLVMVDSFGAIEQRLGYHEAELALTQLHELIRQRLGPREPIFRFSTALMAVVVSRPSAADFETLAEVLRTDVAAHVFKTDNYDTHLAVTVVGYPLSRSDKSAAVVDAAVRETRQLSRDGGNRIAVLGAAAEQAQAAAEDQRKAEQIRKALQENRLKLAYQSIASLEGGETHHFDVLARMLDEAGQEVPAREFIPAAEKHGLIVAIDRWVISRALTVLAKRAGAADSSALFVRLSEQSIRDGEALYKWLSELLKQRPLRKGELVFTVQESVVENHVAKAKAYAEALRNIGAEIAMDKFGSTASSEKLIEHLDPNYVRFDYSFTKDFNDEKLQKRFADLMDVAKKRSVRTIVGQVEDANAMARLWQLGVNYIQGFHVQAPEAVLLASDVR